MISLIVFARAPVPGRVKTRLAKTIGDDDACALYMAFLEDICAVVGSIDTRRILAVDGQHELFSSLALDNGMELRPQGPGDLGARMQTALEAALPACVMGTDVPTVSRTQLEAALSVVSSRDAVVGPSADGGYWLLGLARPIPELFRDMPWSTSEVLPLTLERLRGRRVEVLPFHYDVDDDLRLLLAHLGVLPNHVAPRTREVLAQLGYY